MLGEGLRQELPELFDLWARRPRLRVPRMHPALAALAGLGAQWLSRAIAQGTLFLTATLTGFPAVRTSEAIEALSWALGAMVAFASGGRLGLLLLIVAAIALELVRLAVAFPATTLFCERAGIGDCPTALGMMAGSWPMAVGFVLGVLGRRGISAGAPGTMGLLLGAGIFALVITVTWVPVVLFVPGGPVSPPSGAFDWYVVAQVAAAAVMGLVAGRLGTRPALAALVISAAILPQLLVLVRAIIIGPPPTADIPWQVWTPAFLTLAALLGLVFGAMGRASRALSTGNGATR